MSSSVWVFSDNELKTHPCERLVTMRSISYSPSMQPFSDNELKTHLMIAIMLGLELFFWVLMPTLSSSGKLFPLQ